MGSLRRSLINVHRILLNSRTYGIPAPSPSPSPSPRAGLLRPQCAWWYSTETRNDAGLTKIDLSNEETKRQLFNRLLYRSKQRGFLELDLVLGKWVEENIHSMDESGIRALLHVLDLENPDLWKWLTSQEQPPEAVGVNPVFQAVHKKVTSNLNNAPRETRATPGQPWVRGWDDIKKYPGGPVAGNQ